MDMTTTPDCTPDGTLAQAVGAAELLLAYAAEQGKAVDLVHVTAVIQSKHILTSRNLDEAEEGTFWDAYHNLCLATTPVSRESLEATTLRPKKNLFGFTQNVSPASKSVRYYQGITIVAMVVLLIFQIYWVFVSTVVEDAKSAEKDWLDKSVATITLQNRLDAVSEVTDVAREKMMAEVNRLEKELELLEYQREANNQLLKKVNIIGPFFDTGENFSTDLYALTYGDKKSLQLQTSSISLKILSLYL